MFSRKPSTTRYKHVTVECFFKDADLYGVIKAWASKYSLTHWGRVTHICVGYLIIIGSDNGLAPTRRQAIIWTNTGILLIGHLGTNFSEILIEILTFSFRKMRLKVSSAKWQPLCLGSNVLNILFARSILLHHCIPGNEYDFRCWKGDIRVVRMQEVRAKSH